MNLSSRDWKHNQSEIMPEVTEVGDLISYSDIYNCLVYEVIEKDDESVIIQSVEEPDYMDIKYFWQFNGRWEFHGNSKALVAARKEAITRKG